MRTEPVYLTTRLQRETDGQTDGQGDSSIPHLTSLRGAIIKSKSYSNICTDFKTD